MLGITVNFIRVPVLKEDILYDMCGRQMRLGSEDTSMDRVCFSMLFYWMATDSLAPRLTQVCASVNMVIYFTQT